MAVRERRLGRSGAQLEVSGRMLEASEADVDSHLKEAGPRAFAGCKAARRGVNAVIIATTASQSWISDP